MTEQTYKEIMAAVKESGIPLPLQKIIQKALDIYFNEEGKWIPCNKGLPEKDGIYLATLDGEIVGEDKPFSGFTEFEDGKWLDDEEDYKCVLAWQQLPEPYKSCTGATEQEVQNEKQER